MPSSQGESGWCWVSTSAHRLITETCKGLIPPVRRFSATCPQANQKLHRRSQSYLPAKNRTHEFKKRAYIYILQSAEGPDTVHNTPRTAITITSLVGRDFKGKELSAPSYGRYQMLNAMPRALEALKRSACMPLPESNFSLRARRHRAHH